MTDLREQLEDTIPKLGICKKTACTRPKAKPLHYCASHAEQREAPDKRAELAAQRRAAWSGVRTRGDGSCASCGLPDVPEDYRSGARCGGCAILDRKERTYGTTAAQQAAIYALTDGRCMGCGNRQRYKANATDHNHATGEVRGILCETCNNVIIGSAQENATTLLTLVAYMVAPPARKVLSPETALTKQQTIDEIVKMLESIL